VSCPVSTKPALLLYLGALSIDRSSHNAYVIAFFQNFEQEYFYYSRVCASPVSANGVQFRRD
jgi:hypothetical protein